MLSLFDPSVRRIRVLVAVPLLLIGWGLFSPIIAQNNGEEGAHQSTIVVDNFEDERVSQFPSGWVFVKSEDKILSYEETNEPGEVVEVRKEGGNRFVRLVTKDEALRYTKRNGVDFEWNLKTHPWLTWRWRALKLPEGASERGKNDTGGAVYVTFGRDWLGRPKSIKYTYSSSLPVGTVVSFGPLKVIVVDSAVESNQGEWQEVHRNVVNDYRQVFGGTPPNRPVSITIWSDSDTTGGMAKVDIDDIKLLPARTGTN